MQYWKLTMQALLIRRPRSIILSIATAMVFCLTAKVSSLPTFMSADFAKQEASTESERSEKSHEGSELLGSGIVHLQSRRVSVPRLGAREFSRPSTALRIIRKSKYLPGYNFLAYMRPISAPHAARQLPLRC